MAEPTDDVKTIVEAASSAPPQTTPEPAKEPTLAEVARETFEKSTSQVEPEPKTPEVDEPVKEPETVEPESAPEEEPPAPEENGPASYERFEEVNSKMQDYERQVKENEAIVTRQRHHEDFCQRFGINEQEVAQAMDLLAALRTDPAKAREALKPVWESLQAVDENFMPADLNQRIADGEISEQAAKEIAKLRAQNKLTTSRAQMTEMDRAQKEQSNVVSTIQSWDMSKRGTDPSFKPKVAETARDGLYEITVAKFAYKMQQMPPRSVQDVTKLLEGAYKEARSFIVPPVNGKPTKASPKASSSSSKPVGEPKTVQEVVAAVARKHGLQYTPAIV